MGLHFSTFFQGSHITEFSKVRDAGPPKQNNQKKKKDVHYRLAQIMVHETAASTQSRKLLEMQNLRSYSRSAESRSAF